MENVKVITRKASERSQEPCPKVHVIRREAPGSQREGIERKLRADVEEWLKKRRAA